MSRPDLSGVDGVGDTRRERVATMQRARRLASTAVVAVLAASGLSACRAEPGVAAYVGGATITEARVDAIYADAKRKLDAANAPARAQRLAATPDPTASPASPEVPLMIKRRDVLEALLGERVLGDLAAQRNIKPADIPLTQVAQSVGLPEGAEYVTVYAKYRGLLSALSTKATPVKATPADLRQVYDRFKAAGGFSGQQVPYEQFASGLGEQDQAALAQSIGLREEIKPAIDKLHLKINPRYGITELALLPYASKSQGSTSLIGVPLAANADTAAVTDVS